MSVFCLGKGPSTISPITKKQYTSPQKTKNKKQFNSTQLHKKQFNKKQFNNHNMASRDEYQEMEEPEFDLQEYLRRYLRYWYLFPIFVGLALTAAYFYLQVTQPVYNTSATLLIKDEKKGMGAGGNEMLEELAQFSGSKLVENEIEVLSSLTLIAQVVENLGLGVAYDRPGRPAYRGSVQGHPGRGYAQHPDPLRLHGAHDDSDRGLPALPAQRRRYPTDLRANPPQRVGRVYRHARR